MEPRLNSSEYVEFAIEIEKLALFSINISKNIGSAVAHPVFHGISRII